MTGEKKYIEVEQFEWVQGRPGDVLETFGLGPCIGVTTYDTEARRGHLGHFPSPYLMPTLLQKFLDSIKNTSPDIRFLKAWITGGDILSFLQEKEKENAFDAVAHARTERAEVLAKLKSIGLLESQIEVRWLKSFEYANIMLDCANGQYSLEIDEYSHDPDFEH